MCDATVTFSPKGTGHLAVSTSGQIELLQVKQLVSQIDLAGQLYAKWSKHPVLPVTNLKICLIKDMGSVNTELFSGMKPQLLAAQYKEVIYVTRRVFSGETDLFHELAHRFNEESGITNPELSESMAEDFEAFVNENARTRLPRI